MNSNILLTLISGFALGKIISNNKKKNKKYRHKLYLIH